MNLRRLTLGLACILLGLACLDPLVAVIQVAVSPGANLTLRDFTVSFAWGWMVLVGWKAYAALGALAVASVALLGCGIFQLRKARRRTD